MNYRMAVPEDIDLLVSQRLDFLQVDQDSGEYNLIRKNCYLYFNAALNENTCDILLVEDNGTCVGTGIVFYYHSVPSRLNPEGKNAYITSMYVEPGYRRQGIGTSVLKRLIERAEQRGYRIIMLNASDMGKPIYRKMGFKEISNGMILNLSHPED